MPPQIRDWWLKQWRSNKRNRPNHRTETGFRHSPRLETLEDRTAPAVLSVNSLFDGAVSGTRSTLSLREAIALVDSAGSATDAFGNSLAVAKAGQITGLFGASDTIQIASGLSGTINLNG